jgi:hypothetical protein
LRQKVAIYTRTAKLYFLSFFFQENHLGFNRAAVAISCNRGFSKLSLKFSIIFLKTSAAKFGNWT